MQHQETKYLVDSFLPFTQFFAERGVVPQQAKTTHHYYGRQTGTGVTKLVDYGDYQEIHILSEKNGQFSLDSKLPISSLELGLNWLKEHGFTIVDHVKMTAIDYSYEGGQVRFYLIDDWLHSIVLDYPASQEIKIAAELGLGEQQLVSVPYNTYLLSIGKLNTLAF